MPANIAPLTLAAALLLWPASQASATQPQDKFSIRISGYANQFDTTVRVDGETQQGTPIDLKHDLGLDDSNLVANIGFTWRPSRHHEFGLGYYNKESNRTRVIPRDFDFDGSHYDTHSTIHAALDIDGYEAYYTWWAASRENWSLGPRVGLVWYRIGLDIAAQLDANGDPVNGISDSVSADLPTPTIGGSWRWDFARNWRLNADAGYFAPNINDIDGDVYYSRLGVEWYPWRHSGFLLDYTMNRVKVDADKTRFRGKLDFNDEGLRLGYVYRF